MKFPLTTVSAFQRTETYSPTSRVCPIGAETLSEMTVEFSPKKSWLVRRHRGQLASNLASLPRSPARLSIELFIHVHKNKVK